MIQRIGVAVTAFVLAASFSTASFAQGSMNGTKQETKKSDMKTETMTGPMKSVSCDSPCGFMVRSHNEKELTSIVKAHAMKMHKMKLTDKQIKDMMKMEPEAGVKP